MRIFPHKLKDYNLFLTNNFSEIKAIIAKNIKEFFALYEKFTTLNQKKEISPPSPLNQIFKKILLEVNHKALTQVKINNGIDEKASQILLISDCKSKDQLHYEQKLLYLLKKGKINVDCVHLGEHKAEYNSKFESISLYCGGLFENVSLNPNETNLTQVLLQEFLPLPGERKKKHANISGVATNEEQLICDKCGKSEAIQFFCPSKNMILCSTCTEANSLFTTKRPSNVVNGTSTKINSNNVNN